MNRVRPDKLVVEASLILMRFGPRKTSTMRRLLDIQNSLNIMNKVVSKAKTANQM